jgi:putative oxidoreductase
VNQSQQTELAAFLLRLGLGIMYLAHGIILKLLTFGMAGTAGFFGSIGLPAWLAYVTVAAEGVGGVLLIIGWRTRLVALALSLDLLGAIIWVHAANGWAFANKGGGWEYPAFLILASVVLALLGDGAYALSSRPRTRS